MSITIDTLYGGSHQKYVLPKLNDSFELFGNKAIVKKIDKNDYQLKLESLDKIQEGLIHVADDINEIYYGVKRFSPAKKEVIITLITNPIMKEEIRVQVKRNTDEIWLKTTLDELKDKIKKDGDIIHSNPPEEIDSVVYDEELEV